MLLFLFRRLLLLLVVVVVASRTSLTVRFALIEFVATTVVVVLVLRQSECVRVVPRPPPTTRPQ